MKKRLCGVEDAGVAVLTLTEGLEEQEFLRSRLTRGEVRRLILAMAKTLQQFDSDSRISLQEIDWSGWELTTRRLHGEPDTENEALWFAIRSLIPATLMWLRYYRERNPGAFIAIAGRSFPGEL
jgi:hypothetical protein